MLDRLRSLWSRLTLLQICLGISVAVHVALLGFRFVISNLLALMIYRLNSLDQSFMSYLNL